MSDLLEGLVKSIVSSMLKAKNLNKLTYRSKYVEKLGDFLPLNKQKHQKMYNYK